MDLNALHLNLSKIEHSFTQVLNKNERMKRPMMLNLRSDIRNIKADIKKELNFADRIASLENKIKQLESLT